MTKTEDYTRRQPRISVLKRKSMMPNLKCNYLLPGDTFTPSILRLCSVDAPLNNVLDAPYEVRDSYISTTCFPSWPVWTQNSNKSPTVKQTRNMLIKNQAKANDQSKQ